jgi:periplasmic divalent cation tolerance protein
MAFKQSVLVLTTFPADGDAETLAATLIEERLAACVNILPPMRSVYRWQGKVEKADERQLLIKTSLGRVRALEKRVKELHPYDVPEFLALMVDQTSKDYLSWVVESSRPV